LPFLKERVWYTRIGEGDPLVLIGGSSLVHNQWDFILSELTDSFQVVLYDQRGAGLSERNPTSISFDTWIDDLKEILDELKIKRTHLFGTSNGSLIVLGFALKYPDRVGALIHYGMYKLPEQAIKMANVGYKILDEFGATEMGCYFLVKLFGIKQEFENWETSIFLKNISADSWKAMHEVMKNIDLENQLEKIKAPQLILIGDSGPLSKESDYGSGWKKIVQKCKNVEIAVIPNSSGTYCVIEKPKEVALEVKKFLNKYKIL